MTPLSRAETDIFTAGIKAEALSVAAEHCLYLANNGVSPEDALHMIDRCGRGWGRAVSASPRASYAAAGPESSKAMR